MPLLFEDNLVLAIRLTSALLHILFLVLWHMTFWSIWFNAVHSRNCLIIILLCVIELCPQTQAPRVNEIFSLKGDF